MEKKVKQKLGDIFYRSRGRIRIPIKDIKNIKIIDEDIQAKSEIKWDRVDTEDEHLLKEKKK